MAQLDNLLDYFGHPDSWEVFHLSITNRGSGNREKAQKYLEKYGMENTSYEDDWMELHNAIFDLSKQLPDIIFRKDFEYIFLLGGVMFEQKDFEQFKSCLQQIKERNIAVVQDTFGMSSDQKEHALKMNYPSSIRWDELMSGNFISVALFEAPENNFYIFGDNRSWGMYAANAYVDKNVNPAGTPIRIIGFASKYRAIFKGAFEIPEGEYCENVNYIPEEERPNLKEWIPKRYRK